MKAVTTFRRFLVFSAGLLGVGVVSVLRVVSDLGCVAYGRCGTGIDSGFA